MTYIVQNSVHKKSLQGHKNTDKVVIISLYYSQQFYSLAIVCKTNLEIFCTEVIFLINHNYKSVIIQYTGCSEESVKSNMSRRI